MLKQMRWRMVLSAMAAVAVVMVVLVAVINGMYYSITTNRIDDTLETILDFEEARGTNAQSQVPLPLFLGELADEDGYATSFFSVRYSGSGKVAFTSLDNITSVDEQTAIAYTKEALERGYSSGYVDNYRYAVRSAGNHVTVAFLDTASAQEQMNTVLVMSSGIAAVSCLIVFALIFLLSKRALRPFVQNLEQQKRFITDASHELKTPLTSISTSLDVIEPLMEGDEWVENIRSQTNRMTKMVSDLVTLSRLDESGSLAEKEDFNLSDAAWETIETFQARAKAQGKQFDADIESGVHLMGDRASIQQMLSALLDNAVRYSDEGGHIRIAISSERNHCIIEVFNTCSYEIPPDTKRLFDRFYRPDESRSREAGGTGVGLSIAQAVAEAHGGSISAECPSGNTMTIQVII